MSDEVAPHELRVMQEKQALDVLRAKLYTFITDEPAMRLFSVTTAEKARLRRQWTIMGLYSGVLGERLEAVGIKAP